MTIFDFMSKHWFITLCIIGGAYVIIGNILTVFNNRWTIENNKLKVELEKLNKEPELFSSEDVIEKLSAECKEQKAEIERLKKELKQNNELKDGSCNVSNILCESCKLKGYCEFFSQNHKSCASHINERTAAKETS